MASAGHLRDLVVTAGYEPQQVDAVVITHGHPDHNHYVVSIQRPDWATGFDDVKDMAITSRKRILDMVATDKIAVAGFHMPFPSIGFVEKSGTSYRWVPASYQFNL